MSAAFPDRIPLRTPCPSCGEGFLDAFYELPGVPVNSCIMLDSPEEARAYPRGDLQLGFCPACGFVANARFDPGVIEYSARYEETQAFSGTFNAFARDLAARLVERHDLRGKTALEIGCGKGEFLVLLCELGMASGVGIDPGYHPERTRSEAARRIRFVRDFYDARYADLQADLVCCRHTLEHIAPVRELVQGIRRSIGRRRDTLVFFEVPDVLRVLREGAFWDLYYEHCSYFSPGSLARLFRSCGFDVIELERAFDDQYVLLTARPAPGPTAPRLPLEDDLAALGEAVGAFRSAAAERIDGWRRSIEDAAGQDRRPVVWGSGSKGVSYLTTLGEPLPIEYVVDINPHKHGKHMSGSGQRIVAPEFLREYDPGEVIVMNPIYLDEIGRDLERMGLAPRLLAV